MKVRFKCYPVRSGKKGRIILDMAVYRPGEWEDTDRQYERRAMAMMLKKVAERAQQTGFEVPLWAELEVFFRKPSRSQWGLLMGILNRIAQHDMTDPKKIYRGVKLQPYWPSDTDEEGNTLKKEKSELTTKDLSKIIEGVLADQAERVDGPDFSDFYVLWSDWRHNKQEADPLAGTHKDAEEYREKVPYCEICGRGLRIEEAPDGTMQREGQRMHIVPGIEADDAWLMGCTDCHMLVQHQKGWGELISMYPHVKGKIERAFEKYGRKGTDERLDDYKEQGRLFE